MLFYPGADASSRSVVTADVRAELSDGRVQGREV